MKLLALDPGNSTGWVLYDTDTGEIKGGTIGESFHEVYDRCKGIDVIIYETFNLYPGAAKHLTRNEFYPCQVIGVIKLYGERHPEAKIVKQAPSVKKFAGEPGYLFGMVRKNSTQTMTCVTEHTKDAFLHLKYYLIQEGMLK